MKESRESKLRIFLSVWCPKLICWSEWVRLNWKRPFDIPIDGHSYIETFNGIRNGRIEQDLTCEICGHKETGWE